MAHDYPPYYHRILKERCPNCGHLPTTCVIVFLRGVLRNVNAYWVGTVDGVSTDRRHGPCTAIIHCSSTFLCEARAQTLSRWFGGGVNDKTVGSTTELKAIPRASQHAMHLFYRRSA